MGKTPIPAGSLPPLPEHLSNLVAGINALIAKFDDKYTDLQNAIDFMYAELDKVEATYAKRSIQIIAGSNLTGGGDLTANRTISLADASTSAKGAVQLSTSTNSTSTTLAATPSAVKAAYDLAASKMTPAAGDERYIRNFIIEDGDGTEVSITQGKEIKFVEGGNIDINWTDTSPGSDADPFDLTFSVPNGSTSAKGAVQLSTATNSTSTTLAATPSAVKAAYDLANGKLAANGKAVDSAKLEGKTKAEVIAEARVGTAKDAAALNTSDLDTIKTPGFYYQSANANATSARHYPESQAGSLLVVEGAGVTQIYHIYNSSRVWIRSQYSSGAWTAWGREYNTLNKPSKADVGLSAVNNWGATSSVSDSSNSKYATAGAVRTAYNKGVEALNKINAIKQGIWVGEVRRFSFDKPPAGFFALDGSRIVNGKNDFPALVQSGSQFITISGNDLVLANFQDFGRGKGSSGRRVGSFEGDAIRNVYGEVATTHYAIQPNVLVNGVFRKSVTGNLITKTSPQYTTSGETGKLIFDASDSVQTANENRPKSLTELVCIYHGVL